MSIVVTGGAGFIGSCMLWKLNAVGRTDLIVVDELGTSEKWKNLVGKQFEDYLDKDEFLKQLSDGRFDDSVDAIVHLGACSSTTETDASYLMENNYRYSKQLAEWAFQHKKRFIYASSAATYGAGESGYSDGDTVTPLLKPLNMYGYSKQAFDLWILRNGFQTRCVGLKFFNVYGPNEYHKEDMRSMVHKGYEQIKRDGSIRLFKSHKPEYADGEQKRDFVYVKDVVEVMHFLLAHSEVNGIFNLGTGLAHSWNDLAHALFAALSQKADIGYFSMPEKLRGKYQYFTQADMEKLSKAGYPKSFTPFADAVKDYVDILETTYYL